MCLSWLPVVFNYAPKRHSCSRRIFQINLSLPHILLLVLEALVSFCLPLISFFFNSPGRVVVCLPPPSPAPYRRLLFTCPLQSWVLINEPFTACAEREYVLGLTSNAPIDALCWCFAWWRRRRRRRVDTEWLPPVPTFDIRWKQRMSRSRLMSRF